MADESFADRLKALGITIGAQDLKPHPKQETGFPIETVVSGEEFETLYGPVFIAEQRHPIDTHYGLIELKFQTPPELLAAYCNFPGLSRSSPTEFYFIDTETTGLGLGTGVFAFLIGIGKYSGDEFVIRQYFLRDPAEETAALAAISMDISENSVIVSFNGKAFDVPLLKNRYILNSLTSPFEDATQLDLLHLSRRLWRDRLPSRTLINLEGQILSAERTTEDVPGWIIPQLYKDYLHTQDARLIKNVFYHNAKDILAMVGLLNYIGTMLSAPLNNQELNEIDLVSIGVLHETLGHKEKAIGIFEHALNLDLPDDIYNTTLQRLALIYKRDDRWDQAVHLWKQAAKRQQIDACIELAKYYEHRTRELADAIHWVHFAYDLLAEARGKILWEDELNHRLSRLENKLTSQKREMK
jgi:uncharacterized protein YprB with RNaseH-like and TPR domain